MEVEKEVLCQKKVNSYHGQLIFFIYSFINLLIAHSSDSCSFLFIKTAHKLKEELVDYGQDIETGVTAANILLIGQIGVGKSSFFNSVNSIFRGKITSKARSGSFQHSLTTVVRLTVKIWYLRLNVKTTDVSLGIF